MTAWRIAAALDAEGALSFTTAGDAPLEALSPVELMLAGVAACFVKSCRITMEATGLPPGAVAATVTGTKAADRPGRVDRIEIRWAMPALPRARAEKVARNAKRICTVTNSISAEFTVAADQSHSSSA
ncbi:MAG TPA: OsmC family protein [Paracoccus sp. (in: a-proteobacteria)]|nr:OsmC family protein [Paracoccus sp. (in: a-proteobacteria)]